MTKQEFLAFSLPYELKMCYGYKDRIDIHILLPMHFDCKFQLVNERGKPILHPLSSLTKEIEHKGDKFVPIDWLEDKYYTLNLHKQAKRLVEDDRWVEQSDFMLITQLLEWHFDLAGLIEKCEAIDVNTLTENPYK